MAARTRAELVLLSITFIWGSTFVITKSLLQDISPAVYVAVRFWLATVLMFALVPRKIFSLNTRSAQQGAVLGLLLFLGFMLQTFGLKYTTASKSAFVTGMLVVFTPVCQLLIERRAPKPGNVLGIGLVLVGLFFLTRPTGSEFNRGDFMTLGCALLFGLYIVYLDMFGRESDPAQLSWMQFLACAILGTASIPFVEHATLVLTSFSTGALVYLTIFATVIALFAQARFQKDTTPTRSAIIFSLEPVIAAGFGYFVVRETLGWIGVAGAAVIILGVLVSELSDVLFGVSVGEKGILSHTVEKRT
ncbi:MAG: DMT family transporter [Ignavibacteriales bacterium]|nr:DMT family transporter [Ignavibacteriales bacterium]